MIARRVALFFGVLGLSGAGSAANAAQSADPGPARANAGVEVLAYGPVHEAYASPSEARPMPGPLVTRPPPTPVPEEPPEQKLDGVDVRWVGGYWAWDGGQDDYVWASGFWRDVPPGRQWLPGHWQQVQGGWQWSPGLWAATGQAELHYLPAPPPSLDTGPAVPGPDPNSIYVSGSWVYRDTRYLWRPGFWVGYRPEWAWVPAHYSWTPVGYVFTDGYWDRPLHERGLLFAPVRVDRALLVRPGWTYVPAYVISSDALFTSLFVNATSRHYYFGDYYGERYEQRGFVPWVNYHPTRNVVDYNFAYYGHRFQEDRHWQENLRALYVARRNGEVPRPPRTLDLQTRALNDFTVNRTGNRAVNATFQLTNAQNAAVIVPLAQVHNMPVTALAPPRAGRDGGPRALPQVIKLGALPNEERAGQRKSQALEREAAEERRRVEAGMLKGPGGDAHPANKPRVAPLVLPAPPVVRPPVGPGVRVLPPPLPVVPRHEERPIPAPGPPRPLQLPKREPPPPKQDGPIKGVGTIPP